MQTKSRIPLLYVIMADRLSVSSHPLPHAASGSDKGLGKPVLPSY